ncbi:MAG: hypothetical protein V7K47_06875 [Nostoc sp.]
MKQFNWSNYAANSLSGDWSPAKLIPNPEEVTHYDSLLAEAFYRAAANEADACTIYQVASDFATSDAWSYYSALWLRDEIRHSEAFYRMGCYLQPKPENTWHECFKYRDRQLYMQIFHSELHVWAALALDEWNTHQEYLQLAKQVEPLGLKDLVLAIAADEARHYSYAVYALKAVDYQQASAVLSEMAAIAQLGYPDEQFLFDHDRPNHQKALEITKRYLQLS